MKFIILIAIFVGISQAQFNNWLNLDSCNSCFGPGLCFSESDNLPENCTTCLHDSCQNELQIPLLANQGVSCIQRAWNNPLQCQKKCPQWTAMHYYRTLRCTPCLLPCIGTLLNQGAGQCEIKTTFSDDPCVSESKLPCGTCFRANRCFTQKELDGFGGMCRGYLELKCKDFSNITCLEKAFSDPCSTCPRNSLSDGRFQACRVCLNQCEAKKTCIDQCRADVQTYPKAVPCPLCRAFCQVNQHEENCEATHCQCTKCDKCFDKCASLPGGDFNLFNPCKCLNDEKNAPVLKEVASRILGGSSSCDGDWPWIAYLYIRRIGPEAGICGGTLFNNKWVITAAHCIETNNPDLYAIVLGEHDVKKISGKEVFRNVTRIVKHPFFDFLTFEYDVAVLELNAPVTFTQYIQPLDIAPPGTPSDNTSPPSFAGSLCTTAGWGITSSPSGTRSDVLMQLSLRISPRVLCEIQTLKGYDQGPVFGGAPKLCAGAIAGEDTCQGDSGGPLFCLQENGKYLLHGITSYGTPDCGQANHPGIYTKIADVSTWINLCISANLCTI